MKVAIVGAGKLGRKIAEALLGGDNEVTLIDINAKLIDTISSQYDVLTICSDGKKIETLKELQIDTYDHLLAVTNLDEKNIVICCLAKALGCPDVIARVRDPEHVNQMDFIKEHMNIDFIVNPDLSTATEIFKYLVEKYSFADGIFNTGKITLVEFIADNMPGLAGKKVKDTSFVLENILIIAISRSGKIIIPNGETIINSGDDLYVIGESSILKKLDEKVHENKEHHDVRKVMLAGGGKTGFFLANMLSQMGTSVKIIEINKDRCTYLSEHLNRSNVMVLLGDATDKDLLMDENLEEMDAFVSITGFDEENLLLALLASKHHVEDVVAKISRKGYADLIEQLGISMAINPLEMTVSTIMRYLQGSKRIVSSKFIRGQAEFMEIIPDESMEIINIPIEKLNLPDGVLIAAIGRNEKVIIPRGNTKILAGDRVIIFCLLNMIPTLEKLLKVNKPNIIDNFSKLFKTADNKQVKK